MTTAFIVFVSVLTLVNIGILYLIFKRNTVINKIINDNIYRIKEDHILADWQIKSAISQAVEKKLSRDVTGRLERVSIDMITRVANQSIEDRLQTLSNEMAEKYTYEHFETELRANMSDRIGEDIRTNLLGYQPDSNGKYYVQRR